MQRKDLYLTGILLLVVILIFYPLFYTDYIFTDEVNQLWQYKPGAVVNMFIGNGRAITELLFAKLFSTIDHIQQVTYMRLFSFFGWLVCLPIWYVSLKRVMDTVSITTGSYQVEPVYRWFPFFTCLYLVTSLPFAVSIQWASCMELFIANTSGLLSGTVLYKGIQFSDNKFRISVAAVIASILLGFVSLFTYQSGMGCFLIPFLFHYINRYTAKKDKVFIAGFVFYFLIYGMYFPLYKLVLQLNNIPHSQRTSLHIDIMDKLTFFFAGPFERSFRFTIMTDEDSKLAATSYLVLLVGWMALVFVRFGKTKWLQALKLITAAFTVFILSYLPSMIVKESFASNRTMLALNICVWLVVAEMAITYIRNRQVLAVAAVSVGIVFIISGRNNFRNYFLHPTQKEYVATRNFMQDHYQKNIRTIYFIRPSEDALVKQLHIKMSADEFGIPSSCKDWVPEDLSRQLVFEITGNRALAGALNFKQWSDRESFASSGAAIDSNTLLIDMPAIIKTIPQ
jgi:hypothetical protein